MNSTHSSLCPRCGAPIPADIPGGICPACVMAMNFATETVMPGTEPPPTEAPLSLEELAPLFPSLEILECLGRGGMGVVYKARQKSLNRLVALKLLAPERAAEAEFARRFAIEAEALARLSHPNIVTIHDFGAAAERYFFLLMEFVDGVNLRQAMSAGRMTPAQAFAIVPQICEALQFAHEHDIVHRDIKPENLLLDRAGHVKIADFGIAKMMRAEPSDVGVAESHAAGTPRYMAPEQLQDPKSVDHRADIYSLGVVFYEMLTGELPAVPLKFMPSRRLHINVRLDEIVLRALQHWPELRYDSVRELQTQLENISVAEGLNPGPSRPAPPPAPRSIRLGRRLGVAGTILVLLLLAFLIPALLKPRLYVATVTMELRPPNPYLVNSPPGLAPRYDPQFIATQFQVLRKSEVLAPVVSQLSLVKHYAGSGAGLTGPQAVERLSRSLILREVPNTGLIEVGVSDNDPQMAADIANVLSVVYRNLRLEDAQRALELGLSQFQTEVEKQRKAVEEGAVRTARLRTTLGIVDPDPEGSQGPPGASLAHENAAELIDYIDAKARYLLSKRILEAAEMRLSTARMDQHIDADPVKIWQRAEKPLAPANRFGL